MASFIGQCNSSDTRQEQKAEPAQSTDQKGSDGLPLLPPGDQLCMVLIGKTGQGKSETGNLLCGIPDFFEATDSTASVTLRNKTKVALVGGRELKIIDTPGCMDTEKGKEVLKDIADAITTNPQGFDAFLLVVKYPARMTVEEVGAIKQLEKLFGKDMYKYSIAIFTHGDSFKLKQKNAKFPISFEDYVQQDMNVTSENSLGPLLRKINGRAVLFSNFEEDLCERRKMVISLVEKIDEIRKNMGKRYDNELFKKAQELAQKSEDEGQRSYWLYQYMLKMFNPKAWCSVM